MQLPSAVAQLIEQRLGDLEGGGVEAFSEPVADLGGHRVGFVAMTLGSEQAREAYSHPVRKAWALSAQTPEDEGEWPPRGLLRPEFFGRSFWTGLLQVFGS